MSKGTVNKNLHNTKEPIVLETPDSNVGQSAKGRYKFEVRDNDGLVYDSGDWKPNLILDCGLDKLADMAWANTFQWAVVGTNPTPTVDKYEDTQLTVKLYQSPNCPSQDDDYKCFEDPEQPLIIEAIAGCLEAPNEPYWYDDSEQDFTPNVPVYATKEQRAFGKVTDIGKTIYLREHNLQYKVLSSCPAYSITPLKATGGVVAVSGCCGSILSAGMWPNKHPDGLDSGLSLQTGQGYFSGGAVGRAGVRIPYGDPTIPLLDQNGNLTPGTGLRIDPPNGRGAKMNVRKSKTTLPHTGINDTDIVVTDPGAGYGHSDIDCFPVNVNIDRPASSDAHYGLWSSTNTLNLIHQTDTFTGNQDIRNDMSAGSQSVNLYSSNYRHTTHSTDQRPHHGISNLALVANLDEWHHLYGDDPATKWGNAGGGDLRNVILARLIFLEHFTSYRVRHFNRNGNTDWNDYYTHTWQVNGQTVTAKTGQATGLGSAKNYWNSLGRAMVPGDSGNANTGTTQREAVDTGTGFWQMNNTNDAQRDAAWGGGIYEQLVRGDATMHGNVNSIVNTINNAWSSAANLQAAINDNTLGNIKIGSLLNTVYGYDIQAAMGGGATEQNNAYDNVAATGVGDWVDIDFGDDLNNWWMTSTSFKDGFGVHPTIKLIENGSVKAGFGAIGHTNKLSSQNAFGGNVGINYAAPGTSSSKTQYNQLTYQRHALGYGWWLDENDPNTAGDIGWASSAIGGWKGNSASSTVAPTNIALDDSLRFKTNSDGVIIGVSIHPFRWLHTYLSQFITNDTYRTDGSADPWNGGNGLQVGTAKHMVFGTTGAINRYFMMANIGGMSTFGAPEAAEASIKRRGCGLGTPTLDYAGRGYVPDEQVAVTVTGPTLKQARAVAFTDALDGKITRFQVTDPGSGYSCDQPVAIHFPEPPAAQILKYNLIVKPVGTYENINNNFAWKTKTLPLESKADIYHTEQTYLGQGKEPFDAGTPVHDGEGGLENRGTRYGPCHFLNHGYTKQWTTYDIDEDLKNGKKRTPIDNHHLITHNQYKTNGWYVTGTDYETNSVYCGTDFLSSGNQVSMTRTFDFYMELQPVTYAEIGFKESPASRELFSRIVFDDPIRLNPGQYLRISYQLLVTMEPGPTARYREVPSEGTWVNGQRRWFNEQTGLTETTNMLSGYECIQGNGIAIVDEHGIAIPYDITGVANEPYAPGSYFLGPNQGYVNRWKNGDTRLSFPTREYNNDINNPWILGGDQVNPPDWAIKFFDSPTQNYRPRDFATFLEWPWYQTDIIDYGNEEPGNPLWKMDVNMPPGPEVTLERDAFTHWFTPTFPNATNYGTITWTNFVANNHDGGGNPRGRWDYHCVKPYVREIYPNMMKEPNVHGIRVKDAWYDKYRKGDLLAKSGKTEFRSAPGVFPGPVIEYDGDFGGLWDPLGVSTVNYSKLSPTTGGINSKATYSVRNPYTNVPIKMLEPHNTGFGGDEWNVDQDWNCQNTKYRYRVPQDYWCWKRIEPIDRDEVFGPMGLAKRQTDYRMTSVLTDVQYPIHNDYGGGFTTLDAFKGWSHTPHLNYKLGRTVDDGTLVSPDTAGNWAKADAIPVAGPAAFISTSDASFAVIGDYYNRSHTIFGAVCGVGGDPEHDFDGSKSILARRPEGDSQGRKIAANQAVTAGDRCFETPLYLNDYKRGDHYREKYAEWETSFGNLSGIKSIGLGPVSTTMKPLEMTDSARFNTYVFKFGGAGIESDPKKSKSPVTQMFDNLTTFKLKTTFRHTWYRDLT